MPGRTRVRDCSYPGADFRFGLAPAIAALVLLAGEARAEPRYWALFRDGTVATGERFTDGDGWQPTSKLAGRPLFGGPKEVCLLRDTSLRPTATGPHVAMANGDVVPGRVEEFLPGDSRAGLPPRLRIAPSGVLASTMTGGVTVRADRVLRIVANAGDAASTPAGTIVLADGRTLEASALQWTAEGVRLLTDVGVATAAFDELLDVHVPKVDVIAAVLEDAQPIADAGTTVRLEAVDGAVVTSGVLEMSLVPPPPGPRREIPAETASAQRLLHARPRWAMHSVVVPAEAVVTSSRRPAGQVPLSVLPATVLKRQGLHQWPWRRNRNVQGDPLRSGGLAVDLGVGMHSHCELAFTLPPGAKWFDSLIGLDAAAGRGGCATVRVYRDAVAGEPLFDRTFLRGSDPLIRTGMLDVAGAKRLILVAEPAHHGRPEGADPLDIRDHVDWLLPVVGVGE